MNSYIFLADEGYIFQPDTEPEPVEIESLQMIGTARGPDAMSAYRNLLAENPHLREKRFEKVFCYQVDETVKQERKLLN